jgi:hypothetical protein
MAADELLNQKQTKKVKRAAKPKAPPAPKPQPSQAEIDYGTGARAMPPMLHEMSETSQRAVSAGFKGSMSNWKTREERFAASGAKGQLDPAVIKRLKNTTVDIGKAASNVAGHWERMMGSENRPDPAWYFGYPDAYWVDGPAPFAAKSQNCLRVSTGSISTVTERIRNRRKGSCISATVRCPRQWTRQNLPPYCVLEDGDILLSLTGNLALYHDEPFFHVHVALGLRDGAQALLAPRDLRRHVQPVIDRTAVAVFGQLQQLLHFFAQLRLDLVGVLPGQRLVFARVGCDLGAVQ